MKSKKMVIIFSTALMLSTSAMPVFARGISYNPKFNYGYGQSYKGYKNNNGYAHGNLGNYINTIQANSSQTSTNDELKSQIKAEYAEISTTEQSNLQISKQIYSKEAKIRNFVRQVKRGKVTYTSDQIAQLTTLSTTLQTDMKAITADDKKIKADEAAVKHIRRREKYQVILTDLTTEETDKQTKGTALTTVNSDLDSIITVLQGQSVTTPALAVQSVSAVNGAITVTLNSAVTTAPAVTDFAVTQIIGTTVTTIVPTAITMDSTNTIATLTVPTVASTSIDQSVVDSVSYKNATPISASAFDVATTPVATPSALAVQSVSAVNGTITATLNSDLTTAPAVTDFAVTQTIGTTVTTVVPTAVTMDPTNMIVTLTVPTVASTSTGQSVVDSVSYKNTTPISASAFEVVATPVTTSTTFNGVYSAGLVGNTGLLGNTDAVTVTDGTQVTGVTVNGNPLVLGTNYSISGNVVTVAVTTKTDTVVIQTTGGINNPVTIQ